MNKQAIEQDIYKQYAIFMEELKYNDTYPKVYKGDHIELNIDLFSSNPFKETETIKLTAIFNNKKYNLPNVKINKGDTQ